MSRTKYTLGDRESISCRQRKYERIASIVGDSFAIRKNACSIMAAMIDELSKRTRYRKDAIECIKGCYPQYFGCKVPQ